MKKNELLELVETDTYLSLAAERDDLDVLEVLEETMELLEEFSEKLAEVEEEEETWTTVEREEPLRPDGEPEVDEEFREKMLKNAPKRDDGYVVAERAHWLR